MVNMITEQLSLIDKLKAEVKDSDAWKEACDLHKVNPEHIFLIPMTFSDIDVSARTENGVVYINNKLLENKDRIPSYITHECVHWLQQCFSDGPTEGSTDDNYLDNPFEQEGFRAQTSFIEETEGDDEAEEYIDQVLDHHDVPSDERAERKKELLAIVNNIELKKQAGLFTIPTDIVDVVFNTVMDFFAAQVWQKAADSLKDESDKQIIIDKNLLINACKKHTVAPSSSNEDRFAAALDFQMVINSVKDWSYVQKYLSKDKLVYVYYRLINQEKLPWPEIMPIVVHLSAQKMPAWFDIIHKEIHISAETDNVDTVDIFNSKINFIQSSIRHELRHMYQILLQDIIGVTGAGTVGKEYRSESEGFLGVPELSLKKIKDRDKEFEEIYAPIAEDFSKSVKRFARIIKRDAGHEELISERAKAWVGLPNSFVELAKHLGSSEPAYTDPFFIKLKKESVSNWKRIVNRFFAAAQVVNKEGFRVQHSLRDIEFYTNLADSVSEFNTLAANFRPDIKTEYAKMWVGVPNRFIRLIAGQGYPDYVQDDEEHIKKWEDHVARYYPHFNKTNPLFERLKVFAPKKWQKAVKEFFKAVGV